MSPRKRAAVVADSESEEEVVDVEHVTPSQPSGLRLLRRFRRLQDAEGDTPSRAPAAAAAAAAKQPASQPPALPTPQRPAPRTPATRMLTNNKCDTAGTTGDGTGQRRSSRQLGEGTGVARRQAALARLVQGKGRVRGSSASEPESERSAGDELEDSSEEEAAQAGKVSPRRRRLRRLGAGRGRSGDGAGASSYEDEEQGGVADWSDEEEEEEQIEEEGEGEDASLEGFIEDDSEDGVQDGGLQMLHAMTAGESMNTDERYQLYCQLRLLRLLGALPDASSLAPHEPACIRAALTVEQDLKQRREQSNNLEGWRRADEGLKQRFEECPVVVATQGGWHWGKHCAFCRHDRRKKIGMLKLHFRGRRSKVVWLENELKNAGLLQERDQTPDYGMHHVAAADGDEDEEDEQGTSSTSSSDEGDGGDSGGDSGGSLPASRHGRLQLSPRKRRRAVVMSDDSGDDDGHAEGSAGRGSRDGSPDSASEGEDEHEEEGGSSEDEEGSGEEEDPDSSDSDASNRGGCPRRCPRIGCDCWARALMYHAIHRFPARLDSMLLALTRRYLRTTPELLQPLYLSGLAHGVIVRHVGALISHFHQFDYELNAFNLLQNKSSEKTAENAKVVSNLLDLLYAHSIPLTEDEQLRGVDISNELEAFAAAAARRRRVGSGGGSGGGSSSGSDDEDDEDDGDGGRGGGGRGSRGRGRGGRDCMGSRVKQRGGGLLLHLPGRVVGENSESEEQEQGEEEAEVVEVQDEPPSPRAYRQSRGAIHVRHSKPATARPSRERQSWQRQQPAARQGGQKAAAAVAAASAGYAASQQGASLALGAGSQRQQQQQQRQQEPLQTPQSLASQQPVLTPDNDYNTCFHCSKVGHWARDCPEKLRCFRCQQLGHWAKDCPQRWS